MGEEVQTVSSDIIIVGGGIAGATLACTLAQQTSLSITVLEEYADMAIWSADTYHHRVSAITLASQRIFQALNVWEAMQAKRVSPFTRIQVWDAVSKQQIQFDSRVIFESVLGYIVENTVMQSVLQEKLKQQPQINYYAPIKLTQMQEVAQQIVLTAADGQCFQAKLAIAADGARSWLREQAGIAVTQHDYQQQALVATVRTVLPHQHIARQVFNQDEILGWLPLSEAHTASIVWSLPVVRAQALLQQEEAAFIQTLQTIFPYLGQIESVSARYAFPLQQQQAQHYVAGRVALIGDAAHVLHPLAGQGINLGLLDAASLAEVIADAVTQRRDFTHPVYLRRYQRWRRADNELMLRGVDEIKKTFASDHQCAHIARAFGLNMIDRANWLKRMCMRHAVGQRGKLPKLAASNGGPSISPPPLVGNPLP